MTSHSYPLKPGIYQDIPEDRYHSDKLTAEPAMSAGKAIAIMEDCAAIAIAAEHTDSTAFDIGRAAHLLLLEPDRFGTEVEVIDAPDWRAKAARQARDDAREAGKTPLLPEQHQLIWAMRAALRANDGVAALLAMSPQTEITMVWHDLIWRKARPDMIASGRIMIDYKAIRSANPRTLDRQAAQLGWHQRSAHYIAGMEALGIVGARYLYLCQDKRPPHPAVIVEMDRADVAIGHAMNEVAAHIWRRGTDTGHWPDHGGGIHTLRLPYWHLHQLEMRAELGEFSVPSIGTSARNAALQWEPGNELV